MKKPHISPYALQYIPFTHGSKPLPKLKALVLALCAIGFGLGSIDLHAQVSANATTHNVSAKPVGYSYGEYVLNKAIGEIQLSSETATIAADGRTATVFKVQLFDFKGGRLKGNALITIESSAARIMLNGASTDELGPGAMDRDKATSGTQLLVTDGEASFSLLSPSAPQEGLVRITAGDVFAESKLSFVPEVRDWIATGLIEGLISLRKVNNQSAITAVRSNDGFDEAIKAFERSFDNGKGSAAARIAFYLKGTVTGQTLLTASYDSDKDTRARMLRDIKPEEIYPVFGDASLKSFDAKSAQRLFVRLENGKNYALFGDFNTGDGFSQATGTGAVASVKQRDLGSFNRSLTGIRTHSEDANGHVNTFVVHDSLRQVVDEMAGNGGSFYNTSRSDGIENTEKLEFLVRDKNNPGKIVSVQTLQRLLDYTFEPFNGRILLKAPLQTTDASGNPQSIRITYEVDQGGEKYWIAGIDGQLKSGNTEFGMSYMQDRNPIAVTGVNERKLKELSSINHTLKITPNITYVAELAQTVNERSTGDAIGKAGRVELALGADKNSAVTGSVFVAKADTNFYNPSASINEGKAEAGVKLAIKANELSSIRVEAVQTQDASNQANRKGGYIGIEHQVNENVTFSAGVRRAMDNGSGLYAPTAAMGTSLYGTGGLFNPSAGNTSGLQTNQTGTLTGAPLDTSTVNFAINAKVSTAVSIGLEGEQSFSGDPANRVAAVTQWQASERTKVSARYETQTGLGSYYDRANRNNQFVLGVSNSYLQGGGAQGELFSEYRLRDAIGGSENQLASGIKNTFDIGVGLKAVVGAEHIQVLNGSAAPSWAVAGGLDYTGSELWKSSGRLEFRRSLSTATTPGNSGVMNTLSVGRKLSRDWVLLARNYFAQTDDESKPGTQYQNRLQAGAAYRPVDAGRLDILGKVEYRLEKNREAVVPEVRKVWITSLHANVHPSARYWFFGRVAAKYVSEDYNASASTYRAVLTSGRMVYDINDRWDMGINLSLLQGGGAKQYAYGLETGYLMGKNLWASMGYNFTGFTDKDLNSGNEYTAKGLYVRLRYKFDEVSLGLSTGEM